MTPEAYLAEKEQAPPKEWLRRTPRETHPEIVKAVRAFRESGGFYDEEAKRFVADALNVDPSAQLGHEVYIAKGQLDDETEREKIAAMIADGFAPLDENSIEIGARYMVATSTQYTGRDEPTYHEPREGRAARTNAGRLFFLPPRNRTNGFGSHGPMLVKAV